MQAALPNLKDLVDEDGVNVVEIYNCQSYFKNVSDLYTIDLKCSKPPEFFNTDNPQKDIQYYHRDMCYVFDRNNDAQKGFRRILKKDMFYRNLYIACFQEEIIPSHAFPSTHDISAIVKIDRHTQKINNRMFWIYEQNDTENWVNYIKYHHTANVEMTKMQHDLEKIIERIPKPRSMKDSA